MLVPYVKHLIKFLLHLIISDPREWTHNDLHNWLKDMQNKFQIKDVKLDRFLMNRRALILMNAEMFLHRVPVGGELLFKDFRMRLRKVLEADKAKARAKMLKAVDGARIRNPNTVVETSRNGGASPARDITNEQKCCSAENPSSTTSSSGEKENVEPNTTSELRKTSSDPGLCDSTSTKDDKQTAHEVQTSSSSPNSPPDGASAVEIKTEAEVERPESPILDVTTVDEEETPLEGGTHVTCVA